MATLGNPKNTIAVLQKYQFNFQKKFGQNFLIDTGILEEIIEAAQITKDDFVLEIGPGIGTMTQYLCEAARAVVAVEIDTNLIPILKDTLAEYNNVDVLNEDILKVDISWMDWFIGLAFPALLACLVVPYLIYKVYPPELKEISNHKELAAQGLREIGPMTGKEKLLVIFFVLAILGWATSSFTKLDGTAVALLFFACCAIFKLIDWKNVLANNGAWNTLIWYGAIMGISGILSKAKFFVWLAKVVGEHMNFVGVNQALVMGILLVISILVRYVFASMGAYVGAFIPVLFTLGLVAQVPPLPLVFLLGASSAYGCLLTHYGGAVGPVLFGTGYVPQKTWWKIGAVLVAFNFVLYMTVGLGYWKVLGLW